MQHDYLDNPIGTQCDTLAAVYTKHGLQELAYQASARAVRIRARHPD